MNTGKKELQSILDELGALNLQHMAAEVKRQYKTPTFHDTGRLEIISAIIHAEYTASMASRYESRLKKAKLKGCACNMEECHDSKERKYLPTDILSTLASLDFIRDGMNLGVFGASDSGKTYLAKTIGTEACREFRVAYYHCEELVGELAAARAESEQLTQAALASQQAVADYLPQIRTQEASIQSLTQDQAQVQADFQQQFGGETAEGGPEAEPKDVAKRR